MTDITIIKQVSLNTKDQMIINYSIIQSNKEFIEIGNTVVYGLKVFSKSNNTALEDECIIEDISSDKNFVKKLVANLAENLAFPAHIKDIVVDYISY